MMKYNNISISNLLNEAINDSYRLKSKRSLNESMNHVAQLRIDIQHDGSEDVYSYLKQIASDIGWDLDTTSDNMRAINFDIVDITDTSTIKESADSDNSRYVLMCDGGYVGWNQDTDYVDIADSLGEYNSSEGSYITHNYDGEEIWVPVYNSEKQAQYDLEDYGAELYDPVKVVKID